MSELSENELPNTDKGQGFISTFSGDAAAELVCVFEFMEPGLIWDEHNVVFICRLGGTKMAYHFIHDDKEESKEIRAIYNFFRERGIDLRETPVYTIPPPFFSRVLYPPQDAGKRFYQPAPSEGLIEKIRRCITAGTPLEVNPELSFRHELQSNIRLKEWRHLPLYLYNGKKDCFDESGACR